MPSTKELLTIKKYFAELGVADSMHRLLTQARWMIREDIENEELNDKHPDAYMLRANQAGLALLDGGFYGLAEQLYKALLEEVDYYIEATEAQRHKGALYANIAASCFFQGNVDRAIIYLLKAAESDIVTFENVNNPADSFAITGLLKDYFISPTVAEILNFIALIDPNTTKQDVENLLHSFNSSDRKFAFLAYTYLAMSHRGVISNFSNEFSLLQIFSALRSLASFMEVHFKDLTGVQPLPTTLFPAIEQLFMGKSWWNAFNNKRLHIKNNYASIDDRLNQAFNVTMNNNDSRRYWRSLLVAYFVRNHTVHKLDITGSWIQSHADECFAHILYAMIKADRFHQSP